MKRFLLTKLSLTDDTHICGYTKPMKILANNVSPVNNNMHNNKVRQCAMAAHVHLTN